MATASDDESLRRLIAESTEALMREANLVRQLIDSHDNFLSERCSELVVLQDRRQKLRARIAGLHQRHLGVLARLRAHAPHVEGAGESSPREQSGSADQARAVLMADDQACRVTDTRSQVWETVSPYRIDPEYVAALRQFTGGIGSRTSQGSSAYPISAQGLAAKQTRDLARHAGPGALRRLRLLEKLTECDELGPTERIRRILGRCFPVPLDQYTLAYFSSVGRKSLMRLLDTDDFDVRRVVVAGNTIYFASLADVPDDPTTWRRVAQPRSGTGAVLASPPLVRGLGRDHLAPDSVHESLADTLGV